MITIKSSDAIQFLVYKYGEKPKQKMRFVYQKKKDNEQFQLTHALKIDCNIFTNCFQNVCINETVASYLGLY